MNSRNLTRTRGTLVLLIVLAFSGSLRGNFVCPRYHTVAIPNFSAGGGPGRTAGGYPEVDQWNVVWTGQVGGKAEIFLFDGANTTQITSSAAASIWGNWSPHISPANNIAYTGDTGPTIELFSYNVGTGIGTQLTSATARWPMEVVDFHDHSVSPRVAAVVMDQWLGGPWAPTFIDVDLWDGTQIRTIKPRFYNFAPQVSQYRVVLHSAFTQMTSRTGWNWRDPQFDDPYIVWWGSDGANTEIRLCDLSKGLAYRHQVAHAPSYKYPKLTLANRHVTWAWPDSSGFIEEVWHHDHNPPFVSTTKIFPTQPHHLHGVCDSIDAAYPWVAFAVRVPGGPMNHFEVYLYDLINRGLPQLIGVGQSSSPVYVQVSTKLFPPYGYLPVVVWETDFGGIANKAFMTTRPVCPTQLSADLNLDCTVNSLDMAIMGSQWGGSGTADISGNGTVDFADLAVLLSQWLQCNTQPQIFQGMW